jgi:hypothetical protein
VFVVLMGGIFEYTNEVTLGGMIYISSFIMVGSDVEVILRLLRHQPERPQCWYY